jgi:leucyl-tRNA synthetase
MSKSKKNTIDPEKIIQNFGADATRLFIISDSPPEKDVQWSDEGIEASYKFIQKLWNLIQKVINAIDTKNVKNLDNELDRITNVFIFNIEKNIEEFKYNKIVANIHEFYGTVSKIDISKYSSSNLKNNFIKILTVLIAVMPHFAFECLKLLDADKNVSWPKIDSGMLTQKNIKYVVQINGKTREIIEGKKDLTEENLIQLIKLNTKVEKYIKNTNEIKKIIFIENKLINFII